MFSGEEALGLVMAVLDGHHQASDPAEPAGSAIAKIVRALPSPVAATIDAVRRSASAAPDRAAARPDPATAAAIVRASADRRRLRIDYRSEAGSQWVGDIDPWAVVVRHGRWYVLCFSHTVGAQRAYRVDRIGAVDVLDDAFVPPSDLNPIAMLEDHLATGWEYGTEVVFEAAREDLGAQVPRALGRLEPIGTGRTRLVGSTSNPSWYAAQLTAISVPYRIAGGPELQKAMRLLGQRALAATAEAHEA
jgi:predicted DNA-binding transcriptional regulator YafY